MTYAKEVTYYQCPDPACNKVWPTAEYAIKCCAQRYCEDCGVMVSRYRITCSTCGLKRQFSKAIKLTPEQWTGWVCSDEISYNEGYFSSVDALIEHCEDEEIPVPAFVFCCEETKHTLDVEHILESMLEEAYEEAYDDLIDVDELQNFIDEWNAKQVVKTYYPDYKRVVVLKTGDSNA